MNWLELRVGGALIFASVAAGGCSLVPQFGGEPASDVTAERTAPADTAAVAAPSDSAASPAKADSVRSASTTETRDAGAAASAPRPGEDRDAAVTVELGGVERTRLASETRRDLAEAERALGTAREKSRKPDALERMKTVEGLIAQARSSYDANDIEGASRLAHKARLLALELARMRP
ncbi:MAG: hypothetical protein ACKVU1_16990 [bacterium]